MYKTNIANSAYTYRCIYVSRTCNEACFFPIPITYGYRNLFPVSYSKLHANLAFFVSSTKMHSSSSFFFIRLVRIAHGLLYLRLALILLFHSQQPFSKALPNPPAGFPQPVSCFAGSAPTSLLRESVQLIHGIVVTAFISPCVDGR